MNKLSNIFFTLLLAPFALNSMEQPKKENKLIGCYWYCDHALTRMRERSVSADKIEWVIRHGNRYNTLVKDRQLCVSLPKHLAVVFDNKKGTVVTVLKNMNEEKLKEWLDKRDNATAEDKKKAKEKYERYVRCEQNQRPLSKKNIKLGTLRID